MDIYDGAADTWSTAYLSAARASLAATSLPSQGLALFAGGVGGLPNACVVLCCISLCLFWFWFVVFRCVCKYVMGVVWAC